MQTENDSISTTRAIITQRYLFIAKKQKTKAMILWSYHSPDFSLIDGVYDPEKSKFYKRYRKHYHKLWDHVGSKELVWCVTSQDEWPQKNGYLEWKLEVPETAFFKITDSMVWAGILGYNSEAPPLSKRLRDQLLQEAMNKNPHPDDAYEWMENKAQDMLHPPGDPWASLFLSDANDLKANVLLKHPIEQSWVISTKLHSEKS